MLFAPKEKGQGLVEYALILVLVAIVIIAALQILGSLFDGERSYGIMRFISRYWGYGVGIFVFSFLGCLLAISVDRWWNGR